MKKEVRRGSLNRHEVNRLKELKKLLLNEFLENKHSKEEKKLLLKLENNKRCC